MKKRRRTRRIYRNNNRQWDTHQCTWAMPAKGAIAIILLTILGVCYALVHISTESMASQIANEESRQAALRAELEQETAKWNALKDPSHLAVAMLGHGFHMSLPSHRQCVSMRGTGPLLVPAAGSAPAAPTAYAVNR